MQFTVIRSPAKVTWWVLCNEILVCTADTKEEAESLVRTLRASYG